jgi:hypothetical protein
MPAHAISDGPEPKVGSAQNSVFIDLASTPDMASRHALKFHVSPSIAMSHRNILANIRHNYAWSGEHQD